MRNTAPVDEILARTLHIGEVAFSYYQVQRSAPTEQDYANWLSQLPDNVRSGFEMLGFTGCKNAEDLRRYFLFVRDEEMKQYMQQNLSPEDYAFWLELRKTPAPLPGK